MTNGEQDSPKFSEDNGNVGEKHVESTKDQLLTNLMMHNEQMAMRQVMIDLGQKLLLLLFLLCRPKTVKPCRAGRAVCSLQYRRY
jgi:hypothetical protein